MAKDEPRKNTFDNKLGKKTINAIAGVSCFAGYLHGFSDAMGVPIHDYLEMAATYGPSAIGAGLVGYHNMREGRRIVKAYDAGMLKKDESNSQLEKMITESGGTEGVVPSVTLTGAMGGAIGAGLMTLMCYGIGYGTGKIVDLLIKS